LLFFVGLDLLLLLSGNLIALRGPPGRDDHRLSEISPVTALSLSSAF
jgi:hypothetical protein